MDTPGDNNKTDEQPDINSVTSCDNDPDEQPALNLDTPCDTSKPNEQPAIDAVTASCDNKPDEQQVPSHIQQTPNLEPSGTPQANQISPADLAQIWQWNQTVPATIAACIHDTIVDRARQHPDADAVRAWDGSLTYGELDALSGQLARILRRQIGGGADGHGSRDGSEDRKVAESREGKGKEDREDREGRGAKEGREAREGGEGKDGQVGDNETASAPCIPLCFEKSVWAIVAVLGVLRAGAAFVLTDVSQPEARLRSIVSQTQGRVMVTSVAQGELGRRICPNNTVICLSRAMLEMEQEREGERKQEREREGYQEKDREMESDVVASPSSPMYIIFTSGSTGRPKGVVVSHQSYLSGAVPRAKAVGYTPQSSVFDFPSYAFDVSIDCMLCTLAAGGVVCVPSDDDRVNNLSHAIRTSGANMVHMTPSVARLLDPDIMPSLKVLGLGGEAVSSSDAAAWSRHTRLVIAYGPSECTVACTVNWNLHQSTGIGVAVGGVAWIVDPRCHDVLVPIGAVGELLIEGPIVATGYLDQPEQTAQAFIEDPVWLTAGHGQLAPGRRGRLYKTGDLVRYEANTGSPSLEFVGRKDQQVKLRGQRVELAEVEHHLAACLPSGTRVAALVVESGPQRVPALVAFLSDSSHETDRADDELVEPWPELRAALASIDTSMATRVPRYMVPAAYLTLGRMPLLVSGKTDRKRLQQIARTIIPRQRPVRRRREGEEVEEDGEENEQQQEAQGSTEKLLQQAWLQVLGQDTPIFRHSNFFALGGDSLRAMKLVSAARYLHLRLTVADIFTTPTLASMAQASVPKSAQSDATTRDIAPFSLLACDWTQDDARHQAASLCGIEPHHVEDVYACTPLQEALMALSAKVSEAYVAQRVVELPDDDTAVRLVAAVKQAQRDSTILRTRIVQIPGRGLYQVIVSADQAWRLEIGSNLDAYLAADRNQATQLGQPLARFALIREHKPSFVVTMHHALYDGWCMPLIVQRINEAFVNGNTVHRPADMKHFIRYLASLDKAASESFWLHQLQGGTGLQFPLLPWIGYQPQADSLLEKYVSLSHAKAGSSTTVAAVIRAAWALVTARYTANPHVVFGETLTGRNAPVVGADEIEGPLITTVPIHLLVDADASLQDLLRDLERQTVAQMPHEHMGLQNIRRLSPDAREACELATGLVLHPNTQDGSTDASDALPASRLVPASDAEAAREALKFNTYALMLVCSMDANGFLVMASFDSNMVHRDVMQRVLDQLTTVAQLIHRGQDAKTRLSELVRIADADMQLLKTYVPDSRHDPIACTYHGVEAAYVVDASDPSQLQPVGAVGELVVQVTQAPNTSETPLTEMTTRPAWLSNFATGSSGSRLFTTGRLVRYDAEGHLQAVAADAGKQLPLSRQDMQHSGQAPSPSGQQRLSATSRKQRRLRRLWSRVLSISDEEIGLDDSFFLLGGDSIAAMKLVAEARLDGIRLTVVQIFQHRCLFDMAQIMQEDDDNDKQQNSMPQETPSPPFSLLTIGNGLSTNNGLDTDDDAAAFVRDVVQPHVSALDPNCTIADVMPTRPLQHVSVIGTVSTPRFSVRYELMHFDAPLDVPRLAAACQSLVDANEILHTLFIQHKSQCYAVIVNGLRVPLIEHFVDSDDQVDSYAHSLCNLNVRSSMPHASSFVAWFLVRSISGSKSCLVFRLSHAQYDEMCLPAMLRQLSALYQGLAAPSSVPFSRYLVHLLRNALPASIPYWRRLLAGSTMTVLKPGIPVERTAHFALETDVDISSRPREITVATLPTAAWALCLARRLALRDVVFGEVVSGRNIDFPAAHQVAGPCWQYVPVRVRFQPHWSVSDLLAHVQYQHIASAAHEAMAFAEIMSLCTDWDPATTPAWFDSVVHQDVAHVHSLPFAACSRMETFYPHQEPLDEWKIQAFIQGDSMKLEIITVESWAPCAQSLLADLAHAARLLVSNPAAQLFDDAI